MEKFRLIQAQAQNTLAIIKTRWKLASKHVPANINVWDSDAIRERLTDPEYQLEDQQ